MTTAKTLTYTATTHSGLEPVLAAELDELGAGDVETGSRAVSFRGDRRLLYRANLRLRTATRILLPLREFNAGNAGKLYSHTYAIDWGRFLTPKMTFAVRATVNRSEIDNSMFAALKVKDAIVDHLRKQTGSRPSVDTDNPDISIHLRLHQNRATLSLDSSGEPLTRRGYRTDGGIAPLSEALAAGLVLLSGWDATSPLYDPMCGSGTIAIEAALIAGKVAPGLLRKRFGFQSWRDYDARLLDEETSRAIEEERTLPGGLIYASDYTERAIAGAKENAARAGVEASIRLKRADFFKSPVPAPQGTLIMNPPYGERLAVAEVEKLYQKIGDKLKSDYSGWNAHILTSNLQAAKRIGLRSSFRKALHNGPLECRFLRYELYSGTRRRQ